MNACISRKEAAVKERAASPSPEAASPVKKLKPKAVSARYDWQVGDTAVHTMWGKGKVVSVTGSGKNMILKIEFPGNKMRSLMVAFAPITKGNE